MKRTNIAVIVAAAIVLGACAAAPERIPQLDQARTAVQTLAQDPLANQSASREVAAARAALQRAEAAHEEGRPVEEIVHLAYLAERHAEIGQTRLAEARAREQIARAEAERNRVLLEARTREAETRKREAEQATQEAQAARQEALQAQTELESMQKDFAELQAKQTERGMVLTLGDVLFDTAQATLKPGADATVDRLAEFLRDHPETRIIIEGHTDSRGSDAYNEQLSERRAQAVASALSARGIAPDRYQVVGRGEGYPVASNESSAGRQQNRRVEIVFSDNQGRFAQGETAESLR